MSDDRLDLSPLELAPDRRAALAAAIMARAEPILAREAAVIGPLIMLAGWFRPVLAAAAGLAAIALLSVFATGGEADAAPPPTTAEALGFPGPLTAWVEAGRTPSIEELALSLEEVNR